MNSNFDVIVLGMGGVGSSALFRLASSGHRVLGIDQFAPPHSFGSSHGQTRIIRKAYFEHPDYVPLLMRAYELWRQLEQRIGGELYAKTGLLQIGTGESEVISGVQRSAKTYGLPVDVMSMREAIRRFPGIRGDDHWIAVLEEDAGYLRVEECVAAHLKCAIQAGAELILGQAVRQWRLDGGAVVVHTDDGQYRANRLIIAAGPWANQVLRDVGLPLHVLHKHLYWYPSSHEYRQVHGFPCFFYDTPAGYFYGFPDRNMSADGSPLPTKETLHPQGLKIARHSGGQPVHGEIDGQHPRDAMDQQAVEQFLDAYLPGVGRPLESWQGCYYTMTPDQHFIVDRLPACPQVVVVAGLSGHGFKFTSVLGEVAAQLALHEQPEFNLSLFGLSRFPSSMST